LICKTIEPHERIRAAARGIIFISIHIAFKTSGHIVEFRLHLKDIDKAAENGHKLYQERRSLEAISTPHAAARLHRVAFSFKTSFSQIV
jgi:hypothetical protein